MMNCHSMTSWEFGHEVENLWLGDKAQREHQWQHLCLRDTPWHERQWQHLCLRSTSQCVHLQPLPLNVSPHFLLSVSVVLSHIIRPHMHRGSSLTSLRHSSHLHNHVHVCGLFTLILPFYFLLYLPPLFLFLKYLKSVVNLHNSCNESMDSTDEFSLSTGYEPKAHDFYETSVEPYMKLQDSPPLFSDKVSSADPTLMTLHSKACSTKYIERKPITLYEKTCLSVCRRRHCPIEQGDLLEIDRCDSVSTETQKHRSELCSTIKKEQILAECQARISQHEFQAAYDRRSLQKLGEINESQQEELHCARAEEVQRRDQQLLHGQLLQQNLELREAHQRSLTEMEELRKFQSSALDTMARRKFIEDQNTILALSDRLQELQMK